MKKVAVVAVLLAVALVGALTWKIEREKAALTGPASGSGIVEGEGADLSARISARVARIVAAEGTRVEAGAVVLELECDEPEARLTEAEARLEAARAQAEAARAQAEAARRQSAAARASVGAARAQVGALGTQREVASREADRVESMGEHAALSRRDQARAAASGLEAQERAARASERASERQAAAASSQADAASSSAVAAERSVAALEAVVRSARLAVAECTIRAPRAGVVERVYFEPGELVMPGTVVARLVDLSVVTVTFYLANTDLGQARVGMRARVEADAYQGEAFVGVVHRIAYEAEFTPRNVQTRSDRDRLVYRVEIRIENAEAKLRPGMPVTVTLSGEGL